MYLSLVVLPNEEEQKANGPSGTSLDNGPDEMVARVPVGLAPCASYKIGRSEGRTFQPSVSRHFALLEGSCSRFSEMPASGSEYHEAGADRIVAIDGPGCGSQDACGALYGWAYAPEGTELNFSK